MSADIFIGFWRWHLPHLGGGRPCSPPPRRRRRRRRRRRLALSTHSLELLMVFWSALSLPPVRVQADVDCGAHRTRTRICSCSSSRSKVSSLRSTLETASFSSRHARKRSLIAHIKKVSSSCMLSLLKFGMRKRRGEKGCINLGPLKKSFFFIRPSQALKAVNCCTAQALTV